MGLVKTFMPPASCPMFLGCLKDSHYNVNVICWDSVSTVSAWKTYWKAWIPTVLGNLSFSLVGRNGRPFPFLKWKRGTVLDGIVVLQKRIPPDLRIPFVCFFPTRLYLSLTERLLYKFKREAFFSHFIIIYRGDKDPWTNAVQEVHGKVYAFTQSQQKEIYEFSEMMEKNSIIFDDFSCFLDDLSKKTPSISVNFCLDRQGFCRLGQVYCKNDALSGNDHAYAVNVLYYFIRDVFHTHKHHDSYEEAITRAYSFREQDMCRWSDDLVKDLLRYIIRHREEADFRIRGVFCYLKTLLALLREKAQAEDFCGDVERYMFARLVNLEGLEASIDTSLTQRQRDLDGRRWLISIALVVVGLALFFVYNTQDELKVWLERHPGSFFTGLAVVLAIGIRNGEKASYKLAVKKLHLCITEPLIALIPSKKKILASFIAFVLTVFFSYLVGALFQAAGLF